MIITLTLNPAIDKSTDIDRLVPEKKMRCSPMQIDAGGGGINVSKAIQELGGESIAVFPCGGINGQVLTSLVQAEKVTAKAIPIQGNTRENFVTNELETNKQFRFVMPGPELSNEEQKTILDTVASLDPSSFLICSGSLPPNVSPGFLGQIAEIAKDHEVKFIVDTSGPALKAALEKGVFLLKPNMTELCSLVGKEYLEASEIDDAAQELIRNGSCEVLIVSMGPSGAILVTKDRVKHFRAPSVKKQSTVGAGDSMVAGIVWMLEQSKPLEDAVRFGIACGTAATINKGTQLFNRQDAHRFYEWICRQG